MMSLVLADNEGGPSHSSHRNNEGPSSSQLKRIADSALSAHAFYAQHGAQWKPDEGCRRYSQHEGNWRTAQPSTTLKINSGPMLSDNAKKNLHALITEVAQQSEASGNFQRGGSSAYVRSRDGREKGKGIMMEDTSPRWMQGMMETGSNSSYGGDNVEHDEETQVAAKKPCVSITPSAVKGMTFVINDA